MHRLQPIQLFRHFAGDGHGIPLVLETTGRFGIGADRNPLHSRHVGIQPLATLGQGLLVGVHPGHLVALGVLAGQQVVVDTQLHFTTDFQFGAHERVKGVVDHPFRGVFHRHHPVMGRARFHFTEHFINGPQRHGLYGMAKMLQRCLLGKGAFRAEKRHLHALLQRQAGTHDLTEKARHGLAIQRPLVSLLNPAQHLGFALRTVKYRIRVSGDFDFCHLVGQGRTLVQQILQLLIQRVDLVTQVVQ